MDQGGADSNEELPSVNCDEPPGGRPTNLPWAVSIKKEWSVLVTTTKTMLQDLKYQTSKNTQFTDTKRMMIIPSRICVGVLACCLVQFIPAYALASPSKQGGSGGLFGHGASNRKHDNGSKFQYVSVSGGEELFHHMKKHGPIFIPEFRVEDDFFTRDKLCYEGATTFFEGDRKRKISLIVVGVRQDLFGTWHVLVQNSCPKIGKEFVDMTMEYLCSCGGKILLFTGTGCPSPVEFFLELEKLGFGHKMIGECDCCTNDPTIP